MSPLPRPRVLALLATGLLAGCKATQPGKFETKLATSFKHHITVRDKAKRNPLPVTPATIADGKEAFTHYCVACHGLDGQNTGVPFAESMSPPVPPLTNHSVQSYTDGQLKWVIDNGIRPSGMPGSRDILSDDEIWSIVAYIRHLPPKGSLGEPSMYTQ